MRACTHCLCTWRIYHFVIVVQQTILKLSGLKQSVLIICSQACGSASGVSWTTQMCTASSGSGGLLCHLGEAPSQFARQLAAGCFVISTAKSGFSSFRKLALVAVAGFQEKRGNCRASEGLGQELVHHRLHLSAFCWPEQGTRAAEYRSGETDSIS